MTRGCVAAILVALAGPALAKPPLPDSQQSAASTCIAYGAGHARLVDICREALETPGASQRQRLDMMDSLAWALYGLDRDDEARAEFQRILQLDAGSEDGHAGLGWLDYEAGEYTTAARHFEAALARSPNARVLAGLAASRHHAGEIGAEAALELLDAALAMDPDYAWALRRKGWLLSDIRRLDEAGAAFRAAVALDPGDAAAQYGLGFVLSEQDQFKAALAAVNRALEEEPDYASALSRRSLIHLYLGHPKLALKDAERVIELDADWSDGYVRKARALAKLGRRAEALDLLAEADSRIDDESYLAYWRASLLLDDGQLVPAKLQIARNTAGPEADFHDFVLQTRITLEQRNLLLARQSIDKALTFRPDDGWALFYNAKVLAAEGYFDAAETGFDAAIAAGLPRDRLTEFVTALIREQQFIRAIRFRARHAVSD